MWLVANQRMITAGDRDRARCCSGGFAGFPVRCWNSPAAQGHYRLGGAEQASTLVLIPAGGLGGPRSGQHGRRRALVCSPTWIASGRHSSVGFNHPKWVLTSSQCAPIICPGKRLIQDGNFTCGARACRRRSPERPRSEPQRHCSYLHPILGTCSRRVAGEP